MNDPHVQFETGFEKGRKDDYILNRCKLTISSAIEENNVSDESSE